jgi:hypothetical protein
MPGKRVQIDDATRQGAGSGGVGLPCRVPQSALTVFAAAKDALAKSYWSLAWRSGTAPLSEELA